MRTGRGGVEEGLRFSVVIPTYNRAEYLRECLRHLERQTRPPLEVIVVDSSPGPETAVLLSSDFPDVVYLRNEAGRGTTATSRRIGVEAASGDVVAYVDDDAYAAPDWLEQLAARYGDPSVGGVGGRSDNGRPEEEAEGWDEIGLLRHDGTLTGHFAARPPADVDVDHFLGANMSMRRDVIAELGGIRDRYPGTCLREETDIALRARRAGYRLVYTPEAVVRHVAGTYAKGRRFDLRYAYYGSRNHVVLLVTTLGPGDPRVRRYAWAALREGGRHVAYAASALGRYRAGPGPVARGVANGLTRAVAHGAGTVVGVAVSARAWDGG
jgi:GT2 family glycosyltransferase